MLVIDVSTRFFRGKLGDLVLFVQLVAKEPEERKRSRLRIIDFGEHFDWKFSTNAEWNTFSIRWSPFEYEKPMILDKLSIHRENVIY